MYCPACKELILQWVPHSTYGKEAGDWVNLIPQGANRSPVPPEVPPEIAADYVEACNVLPISPKASAALSRRCLQAILHSHGYRDRTLDKEIQRLLDEPDPRRAIPETLRVVVDGVRNFGNFSAHPIEDKATALIIAVEPNEAEWCLEIIEEAFQHFYVRPAEAVRRKAALDAKLAAAGKPASK